MLRVFLAAFLVVMPRPPADHLNVPSVILGGETITISWRKETFRQYARHISHTVREVKRKYGGHATKIGKIHHIRRDLIIAMIAVESGGDQYARSHKGALGLMQILPRGALKVAQQKVQRIRPFHPWDNIWAGAHYLRHLMDVYGYTLPEAIAAYNLGPSGLERYKKKNPSLRSFSYLQKVVLALYFAQGLSP